MKKEYFSPEFELVKVTLLDALLTSVEDYNSGGSEINGPGDIPGDDDDDINFG